MQRCMEVNFIRKAQASLAAPSAPGSVNTSLSGQVLACSWKISSGSTAACAASAPARAAPRAHLGTGLRGRSRSSSLSLPEEDLRAHAGAKSGALQTLMHSSTCIAFQRWVVATASHGVL